MKLCVLLSLLSVLGWTRVHGAPVELGGLEEGSCEDPSALSAAKLALTEINQDRKEGYIFSLHRLSNVHTAKHGENSEVFYLTLDVVETNCSVLSRKDWSTCEARPIHDTPVYGQCQAAIFISKVHRVVRLYKYSCVVRPAPASRLVQICPDCPTLISLDNAEVQKTVSLSLEKFNRESGLANRFSLLQVTRASSGMAMGMYYNVEFTIQETTCPKSAEASDKCPHMECEFAHKGFCKASHYSHVTDDTSITVQCEIYEPEAAEREQKLHLLGGETDHSHNDTHADGHDHDHAHAADVTHTHDHAHDHTKSHTHHDDTQAHANDGDHHHTHDHSVGSAHRHAHDHSHDHGHGHNHAHAHHAKAHNHSGDVQGQHHDYKHADGVHTHEHDHELALDHEHKHAHLHEHEHHHHHHDHEHENEPHDHPDGTVRVLPSLDQPMTLPSFPDVPAAGPEVGVTLPLKPDPQIPGQTEPTIQPFPTSVSSQCAPPATEGTLVVKLFAEDPMFKAAA
ncbi:Fetuin-B 16G2 Fetuin-like protein IRL685 Gugu Precursor [Channa argus]|uniref:Fetuin-B 16G2 Fetuin-like protein IRL685 Gugu n=1 Tax=Channa argus TaxID=215402 RepID=A0A6G1PK22_CHAAH|nr:Fetuin-B 16G2 Fetuin-like protein IRL685 Gugu Precursor [Channa argus]